MKKKIWINVKQFLFLCQYNYIPLDLYSVSSFGFFKVLLRFISFQLLCKNKKFTPQVFLHFIFYFYNCKSSNHCSVQSEHIISEWTKMFSEFNWKTNFRNFVSGTISKVKLACNKPPRGPSYIHIHLARLKVSVVWQTINTFFFSSRVMLSNSAFNEIWRYKSIIKFFTIFAPHTNRKYIVWNVRKKDSQADNELYKFYIFRI